MNGITDPWSDSYSWAPAVIDPTTIQHFEQLGLEAKLEFENQLEDWLSPQAQELYYQNGLAYFTDLALEKIPGLKAEIEKKGEEVLMEKYRANMWWIFGGAGAALWLAFAAGRKS